MNRGCCQFGWVLLVLSLLCLSSGAGFAAKTKPGKPKFSSRFSARFYRPMIAYLGMEGPGLRRLFRRKRRVLEAKLRKKIQASRFVYLNAPLGVQQMDQLVETLVQMISARSKGLAKMRAIWNSRFQSYSITSEMLKSVQNASFLYFFEIFSHKTSPVTVPLLGRYYRTTFRAKMHIHRFVIFDCRASNRRLSARHARACEGRSPQEYGGFVKPFRIIKTEASGMPKKRRASSFVAGAEALGDAFFKSMATLKEFKLHAPIAKVGFEVVKLPIGKKEGLKVNQGFYVYVRHVRGHLIRKGYVKVLQVGDNRMTMNHDGRKVRLNPKAPLFSTAQIRFTERGLGLNRGMMAYEDPQIGLTLNAFPSALYSLLAKDDDPLIVPGLHLSLDIDLSDKTGVSDFYLTTGIDLAINLRLPIYLSVGILKKFFLRQFGFVVGIRGNVGYMLLGGFYAASGDALVGFEYFLNPSWSIMVRGGFRAAYPLTQIGPWAALGLSYTF